MANLTTQQATDLVEGGNCLCRAIDGVYSFHKFSGTLDGDYYEVATPTQVDLELDENSTVEEAETAFITYFETQEYKGVAPVITDVSLW